MRLTACLIVLGVTAFVSADEPKVEWTKSTIKGTKAEVKFPGKPTEKETPTGVQLLLEALGGKAVYIVAANNFATETKIDAETSKTIIDASVKALAKQFKSKPSSEKDIKLGKFPGRAVDVAVAKLGIYRTRIYITPKTLYQVTILGPKEFVDSETAKTFFKSFKLPE